MTIRPHLRPLERRVLRLRDQGVEPTEIARRFRRSPDHIERIISLAALDVQRAGVRGAPGTLSPFERRVLRWRERGADHELIATMFRRSPDHIRRVEGLALYRKALALLSNA
jgi:DNA-binding CsgD family transcriptional regulator